MSMMLSIVSPVYRAESILTELVERLNAAVAPLGIDHEIILVEDASPDGSWKIIESLCAKDKRVKGVKLSRNFGQHSAITAGIWRSKGDMVVVIDCDLQDDPKHIGDLIAAAKAGNDIVYTVRKSREHSFFKNVTARAYNWFFNLLTEDQDSRTDVGSFSLITRKVANEFKRVKDAKRHYLMVLRELGFQHTYVPVEHHSRFEGKSSYTFSKLVAHAMNGITFHSTKLLRISIGLGFTMCFLALAWAGYLGYMYAFHEPPQGYTSLMMMLLLTTGLILISVGVLGIYIGNIFIQVKDRPLFIVDRVLNDVP